MGTPAQRVWLVRHAQTEWSESGRHTGRTDVPLTAQGEDAARRLQPIFAKRRFTIVLTSPLVRARRTCELVGFGDAAQLEPDLVEWDYGEYEGRTTPEIRRERPEWLLFKDGVPNGESIEDVAARMRRVIDRVAAVDGDALLFGHGHALRTLAAVWLRAAPERGQSLVLGAGAIAVLGYEHANRAILAWNAPELPA